MERKGGGAKWPGFCGLLEPGGSVRGSEVGGPTPGAYQSVIVVAEEGRGALAQGKGPAKAWERGGGGGAGAENDPEELGLL